MKKLFLLLGMLLAATLGTWGQKFGFTIDSIRVTSPFECEAYHQTQPLMAGEQADYWHIPVATEPNTKLHFCLSLTNFSSQDSNPTIVLSVDGQSWDVANSERNGNKVSFDCEQTLGGNKSYTASLTINGSPTSFYIITYIAATGGVINGNTLTAEPKDDNSYKYSWEVFQDGKSIKQYSGDKWLLDVNDGYVDGTTYDYKLTVTYDTGYRLIPMGNTIILEYTYQGSFEYIPIEDTNDPKINPITIAAAGGFSPVQEKDMTWHVAEGETLTLSAAVENMNQENQNYKFYAVIDDNKIEVEPDQNNNLSWSCEALSIGEHTFKFELMENDTQLTDTQITIVVHKTGVTFNTPKGEFISEKDGVVIDQLETINIYNNTSLTLSVDPNTDFGQWNYKWSVNDKNDNFKNINKFEYKFDNWEDTITIKLKVSHIIVSDIIWEDTTYIYKFKFSIPTISSITPYNDEKNIYKTSDKVYHSPEGEEICYNIKIDGPDEKEFKNGCFVYKLAIGDTETDFYSINNNTGEAFSEKHVVSETEKVEARVYLNGGSTHIENYSITLNVHNYPGLNEKESTEGFNEDEEKTEEKTYYQDYKEFKIVVNDNNDNKSLKDLGGEWKYAWKVYKDEKALDLGEVLTNDSIFTINKNNIDYDTLYTVKADLVYILGEGEQTIEWFKHTYYYKVKLSQTKISWLRNKRLSTNDIDAINIDNKYNYLSGKTCTLSGTIKVDTLTLPKNEKYVGYYSLNKDAVWINQDSINNKGYLTILNKSYQVNEGENIFEVKINNSEELRDTIIGHKFVPQDTQKEIVDVTSSVDDALDKITNNQITFTAKGASISPELKSGKWTYQWVVVDTKISSKDSIFTIRAFSDVDYDKDYTVKLTANYLPDSSKNLTWGTFTKDYTIKFVRPVLTVKSEIVNSDISKPVDCEDGKHVLQGTRVKHIITVEEASLPEDFSATYSFVSQDPIDIKYNEEKKEFSIEEELSETGEYTFTFDIGFYSMTGDTYVVHKAPTIDIDEKELSVKTPSDITEVRENKKEFYVTTSATDIGEWTYEWYKDSKLVKEDSVYTIKAVKDIDYDTPTTVMLKPKYIIRDKNDIVVDWSPTDTLYCKFLFVKPELEVKYAIDSAAKAFSVKDTTYVLQGAKVTYNISCENEDYLPEDWKEHSTYTFFEEKESLNELKYEKTLDKEGSYVFSVNVYDVITAKSQEIRALVEPGIEVDKKLRLSSDDKLNTEGENGVTLSIKPNEPMYGEWKYDWTVNGDSISDKEEITLNAGDNSSFGLKYGVEYLVTLNVSYVIDGSIAENLFEPKTYYYKVIFRQNSDKTEVDIAARQTIGSVQYTLNQEPEGNDVVSGQPIDLTIENVTGPNIDQGISNWTWYWDENGKRVDDSKDKEKYTYTPSSDGSTEEKRLTLHIEPIDQSIKPKVSIVTFKVWPEPVKNGEIVLKDSLNASNDIAKTKKIRAGNKVSVENDSLYTGGYNAEDATWTYELEGKESLENITMKTDVTLTYVATNKKGSRVMWKGEAGKETITVYPKPALPKSVVMKGNGNSNTWIVDSYPSGIDGLVASHGKPQTISEKGEELHDGGNNMKWFRPQEKAFESDMRIYSIKKYDKVIITSDLLPAGNNKPAESWDGSVYDASDTRRAMEQQAPTYVPEGSYTINGMKTDHMVRGLNIIRMEDGTMKKVFK